VIIDTDEEEQGVSTDGFEVLTDKSFTKKKTPIRTQTRMTAKKVNKNNIEVKYLDENNTFKTNDPFNETKKIMTEINF
jgi:hypothetical protein